MRHVAFLSSGILVAILLSLLVNAITIDSSTKETIDIAIDLVGILIGIIFLIIIILTLKSFTGSLRKSYEFILYGIIFQILALLEHLLRDLGVNIPVPIDIHHIIMAVGLTFFGIAAYYLKKMMTELKKK